MVYIGQTGSRKLIRRLWEMGFGECVQRGELPPRRYPWFFDNGAFTDWRSGVPFDSVAFERDVQAIEKSSTRPDFVVLPDIVAGGIASRDHSMQWVPRLQDIGPLYLAVQDGMVASDVPFDSVDGIFVGGTIEWKIRTAGQWVDAAHAHKMRCHIGRAGTENLARWAVRIGADSLDSALPLWAEANLQRFLRGLKPMNQYDFFEEIT